MLEFSLPIIALLFIIAGYIMGGKGSEMDIPSIYIGIVVGCVFILHISARITGLQTTIYKSIGVAFFMLLFSYFTSFIGGLLALLFFVFLIIGYFYILLKIFDCGLGHLLLFLIINSILSGLFVGIIQYVFLGQL